MTTWLRSLSVFSVVVVAMLRLGINDWDIPKELVPAILVFGPHVGLVVAAVISKCRMPCVAVLVVALASGLIGIPALWTARNLGEAGAPAIVSVFLAEGLASIIILVIAIVSRPRDCDYVA